MCPQFLGAPLLHSIRPNPNEFPWHAVQIPSMERFYFSPVPWCLLFYVRNETTYLLTSRNAVTFILCTRAQHRTVWGIPAYYLTTLELNSYYLC